MAGMAGLEPADAGVKVPCLTTWLHPSIGRLEWEDKGLEASPNPLSCLGWVKGLEPSTPGTTIRCSNQLSYTHQMYNVFIEMARQKGFEPLAYCLEGSCSIQLSYWRVFGAGDENRTRIPSLEGWCPGHCATPAYGPTVRACRSPAANYQLAYHSTPLPVCQYLFYKIFSPSIFSRKTLAFFLKVRYYRKKTQNCATRILCLRRQHGAAVLLPSILFPFRNRDTYFLI